MPLISPRRFVVRRLPMRVRGASAIAYALLLGLIGVVALSAVGRLGSGVQALMGSTGNRLAAASNGVAPFIPPTPPPPPPPPPAALSLSGSGSGMNVTGPGNPAYGTPVQFTLTNSGGVDSATPTIDLGGSANFEVTVNGCTAPVPAAGSCQFSVRPKATTDGIYSATMTILADNNPTASLSGSAGGFAGAALASCQAWLTAGYTASGTYAIDPDGAGGVASFTGYCDQVTQGGGWLLVTYLNDNGYSFVPEATTSGTPGLSANYSLDISPAGFTFTDRLVRFGASLATNSIIAVTDKLSNGHGFKTGATHSLIASNNGSASGCKHYSIQNTSTFCNQNNQYSCANNALAGRERESTAAWCNSGFNGALAMFIR